MKPVDTCDATYFVSPDGDDANPGSVDMPFATLLRARDAVRARMSESPNSDCTVLFREGTYRFTDTVVFDLADSAPEGLTNTYAAYPGETVVFSGGVQIPGRSWRKLNDEPEHLSTKARDHIWVADIDTRQSISATEVPVPGTFSIASVVLQQVLPSRA